MTLCGTACAKRTPGQGVLPFYLIVATSEAHLPRAMRGIIRVALGLGEHTSGLPTAHDQRGHPTRELEGDRCRYALIR